MSSDSDWREFDATNDSRRSNTGMTKQHQAAVRREKAIRLKNYSFFKSTLMGTIANLVELMLFFPLESVKTACQFFIKKGKLNHIYSSPLTCAIMHMEDRGIKGFYTGVQPLILASFARTMLRTYTYEYTSVVYSKKQRKQMQKSYLFWLGVVEAMFIITPFENIKTRMVYSSYHFSHTHLTQAFVDMTRQHGIRALFRGLFPTSLKYGTSYYLRYHSYFMLLPYFDQLVGTAQKRIYDAKWKAVLKTDYGEQFINPDGSIQRREYVYKRSPYAPLIVGSLSGCIGVYGSMPFDTAKTQMQQTSTHCKTIFHAFSYIYREGGWRGFFRGTTPRLIRATIATPLTFTIYEQLLLSTRAYGPSIAPSVGRIDI